MTTSPASRHGQPRPNRRYRRLLPTAMAVAALAAGGTALGPSPARAAGGPPPRVRPVPPGKRTAVVPRVVVRAGDGAQGATST